MATTSVQGLPYPLSSDTANVPNWMQQLAQAVETKLVMVFASNAARDAAIPVPTNGMLVYNSGTGELQLRSNGVWFVTGGRAQPFAMAMGTVSMTTATVGSVAYGNSSPTFPAGRFTLAPNCFATVSMSGGAVSNGFLTFECYSITTSGFTMQGAWEANSSTATVTVAWLAIQMTASSVTG